MAAPAEIAAFARNPLLSDEEIVARIRRGEIALFEVLMRRHNQRVYRVVRAILRNEAESEEAMQQAYLAAYSHLDQFNGSSKFSTWLTRIAVNEALGRIRKATPLRNAGESEDSMSAPSSHTDNPEERASHRELVQLLENAMDELPEVYRTILMIRQIEGLSTAEAAEALCVSEEVVKVRLHRARALLKGALMERLDGASQEAFPFHLGRCDRVVEGVMDKLLE